MQKINLVCVGGLKEDYYRAAADEYLKRLKRFADVSVVEIPEKKTLKEEGEHILKACSGEIVALCVEGEKLSSENFAKLISGYKDTGKTSTFVIGSSDGLDAAVKRAAARRVSFSDMTFPHRLMRVILLEQLYRAFMINGGGEYHK